MLPVLQPAFFFTSMTTTSMNLNPVSRGPVALLALALVISVAGAAEPAATRSADEDVNSPSLRQKPGLTPGANLLFNGWGVSPAGEHVRVSDMPLKMIVAPDRK